MSLVPYDDRDGVIWMDGEMVPWRDAKLHVLSHALHYASCVFEGERVYDGRIFKLTEHSQRLAESGATLGFELPYDVATINRAASEPAQPRSGIRQSTGSWPWAAIASLIWVKGREPKNFFADSGEGCAPLTTTCRSSSMSGSFFCA